MIISSFRHQVPAMIILFSYFMCILLSLRCYGKLNSGYVFRLSLSKDSIIILTGYRCIRLFEVRITVVIDTLVCSTVRLGVVSHSCYEIVLVRRVDHEQTGEILIQNAATGHLLRCAWTFLLEIPKHGSASKISSTAKPQRVARLQSCVVWCVCQCTKRPCLTQAKH